MKLKNVINKHKSNKIKENSNTVRHLNNGTDHRHSKSCCDQSSPARRTITGSTSLNIYGHDNSYIKFLILWLPFGSDVCSSQTGLQTLLNMSIQNVSVKWYISMLCFHWCILYIVDLHCSTYFRIINNFWVRVFRNDVGLLYFHH